MQSTRWWHVAIVGTALVLAAILAVDDHTAGQLVVAGVALMAFMGSWFGFGRRCGENSTGSVVFIAVTILFSATMTYLDPSLAIVQCIAFPLIWTRLDGYAVTVPANLVLAIGVGVAMALGTGSVVQSIVIEGISVAFSLALGLWITGIAHQSLERQRLLDELRAAQEQLAALSRDAGVTSERDRLAREIHDTIAQDLTGIVLIAQRASRELANGADDAASAQLDLLEENARAALAETRALVASTASPGLEGGVAAAIARLASRFERETGIVVTVEAADATVDRGTEVVLLRCAQEGLANVRKHSGATRVTLHLDGRELRISDNGRGFDTGSDSSGFGLSGMRDRLALVGGSLDVSSGATGTTLRVVT